MKQVIYSILFFAIITTHPLFGQGWRKEYNEYNGIVERILQCPDNGFVIVGPKRIFKTDADGSMLWKHSLPDFAFEGRGNKPGVVLPSGEIVAVFTTSDYEMIILKLSADGTQVWQQLYQYQFQFIAHSIDSTEDGGFVISGAVKEGSNYYLSYLKTDSNGNQIWFKQTISNSPSIGASVIALSDGGLAIAGSRHLSPGGTVGYLLKTNADGEFEWEKEYSSGQFSELVSVVESNDNQIVVLGYDQGTNTSFYPSTYAIINKITLTGEEVWANTSESIFQLNSSIIPSEIVAKQDGGFLVCGTNYNDTTSSPIQGFLLDLDDSGEPNWIKFQTHFGQFDQYHSIVNTIDGGFAISGISQKLLYWRVLVVKTNSLGDYYSNSISGKVILDENQSCTDESEMGVQHWVVKAEGNNSFYAITDSLGYFEMLVDTGAYSVSVEQFGYWTSCEDVYNIILSSFYDTTYLSIPIQAAVECPLMEISVATPILRLCEEGYYSINYCNYGTVPADDATVQIALDSSLQYLNATAPLLTQNGHVLTFDIGSVNINECGGFRLNFELSCDAALVGQTLCTEAHIFPDSICNNTWTGANLEVSGICEGDSIHFTITNTGGDMPDPFEYIVIEDNIILMTDEFELLENQSIVQSLEAASGATYHLIAAQDPNLPPILGNTIATASVEGCVGDVNPGAFNQFPQDDGEPWLDIDCHEVVASFDPNDKTGFPTGWAEEHFIDENTALDYLIRFQNTGTDTAFRVVLIDTLSSFLDPATIRLGASSHPYIFELSGQGVAKFIFENILLPDSNVNEALSHGFVQFHVAQKPDNQPGTLIENTAGIYFDFNAPVVTNTTFHKVRGPWVQVVSGSLETYEKEVTVKISPNPMGDWAIFELEKLQPGENTLTILDALGREVIRQPFSQDKTVIERSSLTAGNYFFKVENGDGLVATGKLVVR